MKAVSKENTWGRKSISSTKKLVPYFGKRKMCDIHSKEVIAWQNEMLSYRDKNGKPYSPVYLKTLHNQLSAVFNHAVRHYNLKVNPAAQAGNMGKPKGREMLFWTKAEYPEIRRGHDGQAPFLLRLWKCSTGAASGRSCWPSLLATSTLRNRPSPSPKSYQRIKGKDVITDPQDP